MPQFTRPMNLIYGLLGVATFVFILEIIVEKWNTRHIRKQPQSRIFLWKNSMKFVLLIRFRFLGRVTPMWLASQAHPNIIQAWVRRQIEPRNNTNVIFPRIRLTGGHISLAVLQRSLSFNRSHSYSFCRIDSPSSTESMPRHRSHFKSNQT